MFFHFFLDGKVEQKIKTNVYSATFVLIHYSTVFLLKTQQQTFIQHRSEKTRIRIFENEAFITNITCTI